MRKLPKVISESQFLEGLKAVNSNKDKLAFMLGFYQCMRVSEVVKLKKQEVDMEQGFLHIKQAKGSKDRDVPIMPPVKYGLRNLPLNYGIRALQKKVKKYWPDIHFHTLRHSGASYYLNERKIDIRYIQQLLGHSRLDTTMIYTHINPSQLKNVFVGGWC